MALLKILKFAFGINHVNETDLRNIGIPADLCKDALSLLQKRSN